jgi:ComF family protein
MVNSLIEGLFPSYCIFCARRSDRPLPLCLPCEQDLVPNQHACERCALPLVYPGSRLCGNCLVKPPAYIQVRAPWIYEEKMRFLIQRWKFHGERRLTPLLASLWLQSAPTMDAVDVIVPVPLHWWRLVQRGYNQSQLLATQLKRQSRDARQIPLMNRLLVRQRHTQLQSGLSAPERIDNLAQAFHTRQCCSGLSIAVVDDIMTTGSTANSIALKLLNAGARRVEIWCLARTPAPGD